MTSDKIVTVGLAWTLVLLGLMLLRLVLRRSGSASARRALPVVTVLTAVMVLAVGALGIVRVSQLVDPAATLADGPGSRGDPAVVEGPDATSSPPARPTSPPAPTDLPTPASERSPAMQDVVSLPPVAPPSHAIGPVPTPSVAPVVRSTPRVVHPQPSATPYRPSAPLRPTAPPTAPPTERPPRTPDRSDAATPAPTPLAPPATEPVPVMEASPTVTPLPMAAPDSPSATMLPVGPGMLTLPARCRVYTLDGDRISGFVIVTLGHRETLRGVGPGLYSMPTLGDPSATKQLVLIAEGKLLGSLVSPEDSGVTFTLD